MFLFIAYHVVDMLSMRLLRILCAAWMDVNLLNNRGSCCSSISDSSITWCDLLEILSVSMRWEGGWEVAGFACYSFCLYSCPNSHKAGHLLFTGNALISVTVKGENAVVRGCQKHAKT